MKDTSRESINLPIDQRIAEVGLQKADSITLEWDKDHGEYPRNWSVARKTFDTFVVVLFEFFTYDHPR
jgi:hypothetical protein